MDYTSKVEIVICDDLQFLLKENANQVYEGLIDELKQLKLSSEKAIEVRDKIIKEIPFGVC